MSAQNISPRKDSDAAFSPNLAQKLEKLGTEEYKQQNSDIETGNDFSGIDLRDDNFKDTPKNSSLKAQPELYPGMREAPSKSILKKHSTIEESLNARELFISDLSLKEDELNGRLKSASDGPKISFNEDIKVTYIRSYKKYNETGIYTSDEDGNCNCEIF